MCPDFVLSKTPHFPRQKHTSEHLFYRTAPSNCFQMSVIFLEREKQKNFFIPPEAVIRSCSVNKGVLKNFTKFTGKHLCRVSLLIKLQAWGSGASVFLWILWNVLTPFLIKTFGGCFYSSSVLDTLETCNCIKLKSLSLIILKKTTPIYLSIFLV